MEIDFVSSFCFSVETVKFTNSTCWSTLVASLVVVLVLGAAVDVNESACATKSLRVVRSFSNSVGKTLIVVGEVVGASCVTDGVLVLSVGRVAAEISWDGNSADVDVC